MGFSRRSIVLAALSVAVLLAVAAVALAGRDRDVSYTRTAGHTQRLDIFRPTGFHGRRPAVLLFHGGGWSAGDKSELSGVARRLAQDGFVAISFDYSLEPPAPYPSTIRDAQSAVRWVRRHARGLDVDPARLGALGSSAGGNLAALLATMGRGSRKHGTRLRAAVSYSGPMDLAYRTRSSSRPIEYLGCTPRRCPRRYAYASPMHHVDRTDPPLLVVNSRLESMAFSQATRMVRRMRQRHQPHTLIALPGYRHALEYEPDVRARTLRFLKRELMP